MNRRPNSAVSIQRGCPLHASAAAVMNPLSHTFRRACVKSYAGFAAANNRNRLQATARRCYAQAHDEKKRSDIPWLAISVAVTVPAVIYLLRAGPEETQHGAFPKRPLVKKPEEGVEPQSRRDPADVIKPPKSFEGESGAQTTKQQGLTNKETQHPYLYAPGKSEKPEGITDSSKVMGTVSPARGKE
ncbi:hypothetical protein UA08_06610 [Talaromyces atroroseus]|uniref:Uncharacterized protein n=1 Tax=Talaromyces atroroseus TaxID=1441469 RepID=A0A225AGK7_TALAT|nr:hypothetical protein UA08_06610 [Talaromyces atroroseus]OKL58303.1 hypothetical protein UA08_06610 [Talaromyces atroroseus]